MTTATLDDPMNIFMLDHSPKIAAQSLNDLHLKKMILETVQILDGGTRPFMTNRNPRGGPYEIVRIPPTQRDNRVIHSVRTRWVFEWTFGHYHALLEEYLRRFGRNHSYASATILKALAARYADVEGHLQSGPGLLLAMGRVSMDPLSDRLRGRENNVAPDLDTAVQAHRMNYALTKLTYGRQSLPTLWTKRAPPAWLKARATSLGKRLKTSDDGRCYMFTEKHHE